ncbi:MAG: Rid family detoxifying hydrolase [Proteobacteria bacterium]|nr:Rid family detoxifying hydrolase [Pseudomonadota bacterium]
MPKTIIAAPAAPKAIGPYSHALAVSGGTTIYLSGQIPLNPDTMNLVEGDFEAQARQAFHNLAAVAEAAGGDFSNLVKLTLYLTDLANFPVVNTVMAEFFSDPYPARAAVGVAQLPRGAAFEVEAIMVID